MMTEDGKRRTENGGRKTEGRGQRTEDRKSLQTKIPPASLYKGEFQSPILTRMGAT